MKTILFMVQTVNGIIAGEDGRPPGSDVEMEEFRRVAEESRNIIIGRTSYESMARLGVFEDGHYRGSEVIVVSRGGDIRGFKTVDSPAAAVEHVRSQGYERAHVAGGGVIAAAFLEEDLIDEIWVDIEPKIISRGINFVDAQVADLQVDMKLIEQKMISEGVIQLRYEVVK